MGSDMDVLQSALDSVRDSQMVFCKFLSANDSGETGSHQRGVLISKSARRMLFPDERLFSGKVKRTAKIMWQNEESIRCTFTYYESKKGECRITGFGRNFEYIQPEMTGSIFVLTKQSDDEYSAYILEDEDDIDLFLETQNISASETNRIIIDRESASPESLERTVISKYVKSMGGVFPSTNQMSFYARDICREMWGDKIDARRNPDRALLEWIGTEYSLYREVEHEVYWGQVGRGFDDMDSFLELAKKVTNTRKSRSGKSLEHQLHQVLLCNDIPFSEQAVTEESKTPDFIIPSISMYHDPSYPVEKLLSLAAKTTCKDRWRQILNEADRLRDRPKYLCTLQQGLSSKQLEEMKAENVVLVVPSEYIRLYPQHDPKAILSLGQFIRHVKAVLDV